MIRHVLFHLVLASAVAFFGLYLTNVQLAPILLGLRLAPIWLCAGAFGGIIFVGIVVTTRRFPVAMLLPHQYNTLSPEIKRESACSWMFFSPSFHIWVMSAMYGFIQVFGATVKFDPILLEHTSYYKYLAANFFASMLFGAISAALTLVMPIVVYYYNVWSRKRRQK